ncbi:DExH-box splicing factor binding site-domain-containing protein [Gautieria morchelliformis]|nr:DExH-box splicing factor binding site-domain-containing protein [Gautieria morchelliformis]
MTSKVSFTIHPPTTSSRTSTHPTNTVRAIAPRNNTFIPHAIDSSDEDGEDGAIEAVTGFDQAGAQRLHEKPKASGPLVIPALANRDWRAVARIRKQVVFIPDGVAVPTGRDGSQGGLGTRDSINSGPQAAGLVIRKKLDPAGAIGDGSVKDKSVKDESVNVLNETLEKSEEDEDERARRALLANVAGGSDERFTIDAIPVSNNNFSTPVDETDAYKQDVVTRPESATLADYERVPVSQFGAALLRGMGWKEGTAASRTRPGLVEPWLPTARPALLGIGAKERPQEDIPSATKGGHINQRPEKRYVPVIKLQREHMLTSRSRVLSFGQDHAHPPVPERCLEYHPQIPPHLTPEMTIGSDCVISEVPMQFMMNVYSVDRDATQIEKGEIQIETHIEIVAKKGVITNGLGIADTRKTSGARRRRAINALKGSDILRRATGATGINRFHHGDT